MNTAPHDNDSYAEFPVRGELRIVRLLPGPIERIWEFLTDPEKRSRWFAGGVTEPRAGGKIEFVMHHSKLSPGETPPEKYAQVHEPGVTFEGRVLRYEPPRVLSYTFGDEESQVTFELRRPKATRFFSSSRTARPAMTSRNNSTTPAAGTRIFRSSSRCSRRRRHPNSGRPTPASSPTTAPSLPAKRSP